MKINNIQHLRGLAAFLVLLGHAVIQAREYAAQGGHVSVLPDIDPTFGVDIFFVISGFIMWFTTKRLWGGLANAGEFMRRRLVRIVPLYWAFTAALGAITFISQMHQPGTPITLAEVIRSLTFVPYADDHGHMRPILGVGWTLDFEMFFYTVFAAGLVAGRRWGPAVVCGTIFALIAAHPLARTYPFAAWTSPIMLEFVAGILLGMWFETRDESRASFPLLAPVIAIVAIQNVGHLAWPDPHADSAVSWRPVTWALAIAIVWIALRVRQSRDETVFGKAMTRLGDASYSLYVSHPVTFRLYDAAIAKLHLASAIPWPAYGVGLMLVSLAGAWIAYVLFERPVTEWLSRATRPQLALQAAPAR